MTAADDDAPKLPRGRGLKLSTPELFRIAITLAFLVAVIVLTKPCSNAVSTFVMGFGSGSGSGSAKAAGSAQPDPYEHLTPGMTEDQVKAAIERSKARNAGDIQAGSAAGTPSGSAAADPASSRVLPGPGSASGSGRTPTRATFTPPPGAAGSSSMTTRRAAGSATAP